MLNYLIYCLIKGLLNFFLTISLIHFISIELKECFKSFDKDGSGYISASELGSVCEALGLVVSEGDLTHLLKLMDTDGSGCVDFKVTFTG